MAPLFIVCLPLSSHQTWRPPRTAAALTAVGCESVILGGRILLIGKTKICLLTCCARMVIRCGGESCVVVKYTNRGNETGYIGYAALLWPVPHTSAQHQCRSMGCEGGFIELCRLRPNVVGPVHLCCSSLSLSPNFPAKVRTHANHRSTIPGCLSPP